MKPWGLNYYTLSDLCLLTFAPSYGKKGGGAPSFFTNKDFFSIMRVGRQTCIYYAINLLANEFSHDPRCAQSMFCDINGNGTKIMEMSLKTACVIHKKMHTSK